MNEKTYHETLGRLKDRNLIRECNDVFNLTEECFQLLKEKTHEFFNLSTSEQSSAEDCITTIMILTILETGPAFDEDLYHMWSVLKILLFAHCPKLEKLIIDDVSSAIDKLESFSGE